MPLRLLEESVVAKTMEINAKEITRYNLPLQDLISAQYMLKGELSSKLYVL